MTTASVVPQQPKQSVRKQAQGALERIGEVEKNVMTITSVVNRTFGVFQQQLSSATEIVDAIVGILGIDTVTNAVTVNRQEKNRQAAESRRKSVAEALEKGTLVAEAVVRPCIKDGETVVDQGSTVASVMVDANGVEMSGTYFVMPMSSVNPQFQEQLTGKEVGYEIPNEEAVLDEKGQPVLVDGKPTMALVSKAVVTGIYREVPADKAQPLTPAVAPVAAPESSTPTAE